MISDFWYPHPHTCGSLQFIIMSNVKQWKAINIKQGYPVVECFYHTLSISCPLAVSFSTIVLTSHPCKARTQVNQLLKWTSAAACQSSWLALFLKTTGRLVWFLVIYMVNLCIRSVKVRWTVRDLTLDSRWFYEDFCPIHANRHYSFNQYVLLPPL